MKMLLTFILMLSTAQLHASGEEESRACEKIVCSDMQPEERYHCYEQKKLCHRRAFGTLLTEWKKEGIASKKRSDVLKALEDALGKNKEVTKRLEREVTELKSDIKEIEQQIDAVKKLKVKN